MSTLLILVHLCFTYLPCNENVTPHLTLKLIKQLLALTTLQNIEQMLG